MPPVSVTSQARNFAAVVVLLPPAAAVVVVELLLDPQAASTLAASTETANPVIVLRKFRVRLMVCSQAPFHRRRHRPRQFGNRMGFGSVAPSLMRAGSTSGGHRSRFAILCA
jgi:hypothetical protein